MSGYKEPNLPHGNRLLSALSKQDYERLRPHLELVHLAAGRILYHPGEAIEHAYFLLTGMATLVATTESGSAVAVAMTGNERLIGLTLKDYSGASSGAG
ncbi:MAG TPA: cyclic nucleotide-binding domain-containing protein [Pyrinomonadaceae bacterium]